MNHRLTTGLNILAAAITSVLLWALVASAGEQAATLMAVDAHSDLGQARLSLDFSRIPSWDLRILGQKLEIRLKNTSATGALGSLPEDENIVKTIIARDHQDLIVSVLLRRVPSSAIASPDLRTHRLAVDIRWLQKEKNRPAIVFDLPGIPGFRRIGAELRATGSYQSPWQGHWKDFLQRSHTPITIFPKPVLTLPLLPPPAGLPKSLQNDWQAGNWDKLAQTSAAQTDAATILAVAEALLRVGRHKEAADQLLVFENLPATGRQKLKDRALYLNAWLLAIENRPFAALAYLNRLETWTEDLGEAAWLLKVETSLAAGKGRQAHDLLAGREAVIPALAAVAARRRADALVLIRRYEQAFAAYQKTGMPKPETPLSLALYAQTAQQLGQLEQARKAFARLAESGRLEETQQLMARLAGLTLNRSKEEIINHFDALQDIRWHQPENEASLRAQMLLTDLMAPAADRPAWQQQLAVYEKIADRSANLDLRVEAALKAAIMEQLAGDNRAAVKRLEALLRQSQRGLLRNDAVALLAEILPATIEDLLNADRPVKALALVERHRDLLQQQHISWDFLVRIAETFDSLQLHRRANRIFLFLYDRAKNPTHKGEAALAAATNFAALGLWRKALNYADRAAGHFLLQQNRDRAFPLRLLARIKVSGDQQAAAWLEQQQEPEIPEALSTAAGLYWRLERYDKVAELLSRKDSLTRLSPKEHLQLAEASWRAGKLELALRHYQQLVEDPGFSAQARYRLAGILEARAQKEKAAALYRQLVEDAGQSSKVWQVLAQDRLKELTL